jgi:hypothetical protein
MRINDDLRKLSDEQLVDILTHIDRESYVERYEAVRDEYARRYGAIIDGRSIDDYFDEARLKRPFTEMSVFRKKLLIGLLAWSALMLAIKGIIFLIQCFKGHKP